MVYVLKNATVMRLNESLQHIILINKERKDLTYGFNRDVT